jgi:N-acyl-D-aspartate/D-glutamate deacylase
MPQSYDLVIRNGLVVDGTGDDPRVADVAAIGGRIAAVEPRLPGTGREEIDARDRLVTPGFVDIHTHYDGQATWANRLTPSSLHGVTSVVMGNCGVGFAPCRPHQRDTLIRLMEGVEDIPYPVLHEGLAWNWESFPQFLDAVAAIPHDIDIAALVPHAALRVYVMGDRALRREPSTPPDREAMARLLTEGMKAGALGFGTSMNIVHRSSDGEPIPTVGADEAEYMSMALALKVLGRGLMQFVLSDPAVFPMLLSLMEASGRPLSVPVVQAHSTTGGSGWDAQLLLQMADEASRRGLPIRLQVLPRAVGFLLGHACTLNPFVTTPTYQVLAQLPFAERVQELRKSEVRKKLLSESHDLNPKNPMAGVVRNFAEMFPLGDPPNYEPAAETSIAAQAGARGIAPEELSYDLLLEDDGLAMLLLTTANYADKTMDFAVELTRHKDAVLGLGDGGAHVGVLCDASYPTSMLKEWPAPRAGGVRMDLAQTVRMLTRRPAEVVGLLDRGIVAPGARADLNVIDLDRLTLRRPEVVHDLPAGGRRLIQRAEGYVATLVNGQVIRRDGEPTEVLPGKVVRGPQLDGRNRSPDAR